MCTNRQKSRIVYKQAAQAPSKKIEGEVCRGGKGEGGRGGRESIDLPERERVSPCHACPVSRSSGRLQQEPGRLLAATVRARVWSPSVDVARGGDGTSLGGASRGERAGRAARVGRSACSAPSELVQPRSAASDPATPGPAALGFPRLPHQSTGRVGVRAPGRDRGVIGPSATGT